MKANLLLKIINECDFAEYRSSSRAIVFVKERQTAPALAHLINCAGFPGVKCGFALGSTFSPTKQPSSGLFFKV
jgi:hypothetical protein